MYSNNDLVKALYEYINDKSDDEIAQGEYPVTVDYGGIPREHEIFTINAAGIFTVTAEREYDGWESHTAYSVHVSQPERLNEIVPVLQLLKGSIPFEDTAH